MKQQPSQTRTTRRHLTSKEKAEVLNEHGRSGLSLLAFAEQHGLCYSSLVRWRGRLDNGAEVPVPRRREADPRFVPVKIQSEGLGGDYVLSWATGRSLNIPRQFDTDSLRRLLSVLEAVR